MGEDFVIALVVILVLAVPVAIIVLIVAAVRHKRKLTELAVRLTRLEDRLGALANTRHGPEAAPAQAPQAPGDVLPEDAPGETPEPQPEEGAAADAAEPAPGPWAAAARQGEDAVAAAPVPPARQEDAARAQTPSQGPPPGPPRAVVFRPDRMAELGQWLQANWIYVVSAVSLAFAGVFLVQYGIENGYLTPRARVWAALAFGAVLVAAGEYLRRRWGDAPDVATAYLPSIFSSAGIVTLFAAILAAQHLYAMIGSGAALAALAAIGAGAVVLGWFSGPLLAAVGIVGAVGAPFVVGGESDAPEMFYGYFALVALVGLLIDTMRRWAWVSVLSLVLGFGAAWFLFLGIGKGEYLMGFSALMALAAVAIPARSLLAPAQSGSAIVQTLGGRRPDTWPGFPTNLAAATMLAGAGGIAWLSLAGVAEFWLAAGLLLVLFAAMALWARRAEALEDLAALPALGLLALPVLQAGLNGTTLGAFRAVLPLGPEDPVPHDPLWLGGLALVASLIAAQRSLIGARWPVAWALGAAALAPLMAVELELWWRPAEVLGAYPWALAAAALAVVMGVLAGSFARADAGPGLRTALATLSALLMISFALIVVLSETALTLALAATVLAAALLDRRFGMAPLTWFVKAGVIVAGWRLVIDPGFGWAFAAPYWELAACYGGVIALFSATWAALEPRGRVAARIIAESAIWSIAAVFASLLLIRLIGDLVPGSQGEGDWVLALVALVWLVSGANQLWRLKLGGVLTWVRVVLAAIYFAIGLFVLAAALLFMNPVFGLGNDVLGPVVVNTLFIAYAAPGLFFAVLAWKFAHLDMRWRIAAVGLASALGAAWLGLEIRHFWRGADLSVPGVSQPELYSYTVALLVVGAGLLYQAIARGSPVLRRVAMGVIALTVAKVFLLDASGLTGLTRVFSFLALGLSLAGLAFLNRWAAGQMEEQDDDA